jgi:16S rRNA (guanine(527)-N(7))-methyltransferase RsmG
MDALLQRCGIRLTTVQLRQLWNYHQLLRRHDPELNLTRIHNFENMVVKLYADSMLPAIETTLPSPLLDLGTGPGMPGIPLKIFRPELHILLAESRKQRIDFLNEAVERLGVPGLEVVERGIVPDYDRPVAGVITRAVESIGDTLNRVAGCVQKGGRVIFMKGPRCDEEIESARRLFSDAYDRVEDIPYQIPRTPHRRRLICYRRKTAPIRVTAATRVASDHRVRVIESENNDLFKNLKKLLGGRGVKKLGQTLVCGGRLIDEVLARSPQRCLAWISTGNRHAPPDQAPPPLEWFQLAPDLFQKLDQFGTRKPMMLYDVPRIEPWGFDRSASGCSLLIPFQDPENVGAVIRSAAAFDADRIILLAESANPFHPKAIRTSAGTVFSVRLFKGPSLSALPENLPVIALAPSGRPLTSHRFPDSFCLLAGMEGPGLPPRWQADAVAVPMAADVESLNAAVATAIVLYEWRRTK